MQWSHKTLCEYLQLSPDENSTKTQLRKSFNELEKLDFAKYTYQGRRGIWKRVDTQLGSIDT